MTGVQTCALPISDQRLSRSPCETGQARVEAVQAAGEGTPLGSHFGSRRLTLRHLAVCVEPVYVLFNFVRYAFGFEAWLSAQIAARLETSQKPASFQ